MNSMIVKNMDVHIELSGVITSIIGPANSGKTVLLKKICNKLDNKDIFIDDVCIKEYDITYLKNNVVVVLDDNYFNAEYVSEELFYNLHILGYRVDEIAKKIDEITKYFKIENKLDNRIDLLTLEEKMLIKILSYLIINPHIFAVDGLIDYLNPKMQQLLLKYIKNKNINLINVTSDEDFLLKSDYVVVMNDMKAILCGNVKNVLDGNSILPYMGLKLPFSVDLSHNLILYGLLDKIYLESGKMVNELWK